MRAMRNVLVVLLTLVALLGSSSAALAKGSTDKKSDGAFTGIVLITGDLDWYARFARPETPQIDVKDTFRPGERGSVAIIFSNAEPRDGKLKIICDITAFDPEGSKIVAKAAVCYEGPNGGKNVLHPSLLDLQFEIAEGDAPGRAGFKIKLRDAYSGRHVELNVSYEQETAR